MKGKGLALLSLLLPSFAFGTTPKDVSVKEVPQSHCVTLFPWDLECVNSCSWLYNPQVEKPNEWQQIDKALQQHNFHLELSTQFAPETFDKSAKIICANTPRWFPDDVCAPLLHQLPQSKAILIVYEPPFHLPVMFTPDTYQCFHKVLTWDDSIVDNKKFFKINYPALRPMLENIPSYSEKKFLTQICGYFGSWTPDDLYGERLNVIRYFEARPGNDFDFYGRGWPANEYRNYKGAPADKLSVLKNYKFSICYENTKNIIGYITEKIFDCFAAGCVPIYWGATNVKDHIPANCFIAREDFSSFDELVDFLKKMDEPTYNQYLQNIRNFLSSEQGEKFSQEAFAKVVLTALEIPDEPVSNNNSP